MRAWDDYLRALEKELGKDTIDKWAKRSLKILNFDAANLYLEASDSFSAQWFHEYLYPKASKHFLNENGRLVKIHLQIAHKKPPPKNEPSTAHLVTSPFIIDPIDSSFTFERLVETSQNKIVFKLFSEFKNFKKSKAPLYNPIYLYGAEGIGKTHLLQATATLLAKQNIKSLYTKLTTFTQNMVSAMKNSQMAQFRLFYRECDVLIVDEVELLAQKSATQEEFFHTFNALHIEGKQIILSSTLSPQQLKQIEARLISRFEWGIVLPFKSPTINEFKTILNQKLIDVQIDLNKEAKDFLIEKFARSPKTLSRAVSALMLRAHLKLPQGHSINTNELTPLEIERLLTDLIKKEKKTLITADYIIDQIAQYFGVTVEEILGKSQSRECVLPRQISMYFCREFLKLPYMKIGRIFSRDHSTVMSSVKQIEKNAYEPSSDTAKALATIKNKVTSV